jgi:hypothetical protein
MHDVYAKYDNFSMLLQLLLFPQILAYVSGVMQVESNVDHATFTMEDVESNIVRCPDQEAAQKMIDGAQQQQQQSFSNGRGTSFSSCCHGSNISNAARPLVCVLAAVVSINAVSAAIVQLSSKTSAAAQQQKQTDSHRAQETLCSSTAVDAVTAAAHRRRARLLVPDFAAWHGHSAGCNL